MAQAKLNMKTETRTEEKRVLTEVKTESVDGVTLMLTLDEARVLRGIVGGIAGVGVLRKLSSSVYKALGDAGVGTLMKVFDGPMPLFRDVEHLPEVFFEKLPQSKETREGSCGSTISEAGEKVPGVFAVGDRVVFNHDYPPNRKGDAGTVTGVHPQVLDKTLVSVKTDSGNFTLSYAYRLDHLKEQPKLRVGARIRITGFSDYDRSDYPVGSVGTITSFINDFENHYGGGPYPVRVMFDHSGKEHSVGVYSAYEVIG